MKSASRLVDSIQAPSFSALFEAARAYTEATGQSVIDFSIGSSNIPPADAIKQAMADSVMEDDSYQYSLACHQKLEQAALDWYQRRYGVCLQPEEICVLKGSQEALSHIPLAFCDPGDIVLMQDPCYPIYRTAPSLAGARAECIPLKKENGYVLDFDDIDPALADAASILLVSYPHNPTGAVADEAFLKKLVQYAREHDLLVVYDNAYSELIFDGEKGGSFLSIDGAKDVGIELNSLSKSYSLGGARLAFMAGRADLVASYRKLMNTIDFGPFPAVQKGAAMALDACQDFPQTVCKEYARRRDLLVELFQKAGWDIEKPKATMFVWAPIPDSFEDASVFADALLSQCGIQVNPGTSFGQQGKRFVRLALVRSDEEVKEAARRIAQSGLFQNSAEE